MNVCSFIDYSPWDVEEYGLKEQGKAHPLVVLVVLPLILIVPAPNTGGSNPWVSLHIIQRCIFIFTPQTVSQNDNN